jgi:hypothetical protein
MTSMDKNIQELLTIHIQRRQFTMWNAIVKAYAVEDHIDTQVRKWIADGKVSDHAHSASIRTKRSAL